MIDTPDMGARFVGKIPGRISADNSSITFYGDRDGQDARTAMPRDATGYMVWLDGGDVAGRKMDVYPCTVSPATASSGRRATTRPGSSSRSPSPASPPKTSRSRHEPAREAPRPPASPAGLRTTHRGRRRRDTRPGRGRRRRTSLVALGADDSEDGTAARAEAKETAWQAVERAKADLAACYERIDIIAMVPDDYEELIARASAAAGHRRQKWNGATFPQAAFLACVEGGDLDAAAEAEWLAILRENVSLAEREDLYVMARIVNTRLVNPALPKGSTPTRNS